MVHFSELFAQLGLPSEPGDIRHFLTVHQAMADGVRLPDAPYWTLSQASFLRESLSYDSDCSDVVDQLSNALQGPLVAVQQAADKVVADQHFIALASGTASAAQFDDWVQCAPTGWQDGP
jgi:hypothetical protein